MSIASAPSSVESTPVVTENGSNGSPSSLPIAVDDDMLYEVVDGKIVEKEIGRETGRDRRISWTSTWACSPGRTDSVVL